jgi:hypothetical protein
MLTVKSEDGDGCIDDRLIDQINADRHPAGRSLLTTNGRPREQLPLQVSTFYFQ